MFYKSYNISKALGLSYIILCIIFIFLLCSACSSQTQTQLYEDNPLDYEKHISRWGELFSISGTIDQVQMPRYKLDHSTIIPKLAELTGLAKRTDLVFQNLSDNQYLYEIPGGKIVFEDFNNSVHNTQIRYRLNKLNEQLVVVETVMEETTSEASFSLNLPYQEGMLYLLSLEAINEQNEIIDTLIHVIEVVPQEINAELVLDQTDFRSDQTINATITLTNYGPNSLYYGDEYSIERYENEEWHTLGFKDMSFSSRLNHSQPGEAFNQSFRVPSKLTEGKYRVVKAIEAKGISTSLEQFKGIHLAVEFKVI